MHLLRFRDLKQRNIVSNWPTLLRWIGDPNIAFPAGRRIGPNTRTWTSEEVEAWIASRPSAGPSTGA
jgi:predicted DNA-binding transcriptional regulator AlpA